MINITKEIEIQNIDIILSENVIRVVYIDNNLKKIKTIQFKDSNLDLMTIKNTIQTFLKD
jgi:hypothetical protein